MAIKNAIPLKGKGDPRSDAIRAKTKGSASPKRKLSQQIRRMREFPQKHDAEIIELISNPEASAKQIQELLQIALKKRLKPGEFIYLINTVIKKHQAIFGTKAFVNVSGDKTMFEKFINRMEEYKKKNGNEHTTST